VALRKKLPGNAEADFRYAAADRGLACSLWKTGDRASAARHFVDAYRTALVLTRRDPRNAGWRELREKLSDDLVQGGLAQRVGSTTTALGADAGRARGCTR
jgi:hypothetical protein